MLTVPAHLRIGSVHGGELVPHYLTEADHPWLRDLCDAFDASAGGPQRALDARLDALELVAPVDRRALATHVLRRLHGTAVDAVVDPRIARLETFRAAARVTRGERQLAVARAAAELGVTPAALREALLADLPGERVVAALDAPLAPARAALACNLALVQSFLLRALSVELELDGNARAIVRLVKLGGLIATVTHAGRDRSRLSISGPLSLLRQTTRYGRALAGLVPHLPWCRRFRLQARCAVGPASRVDGERSDRPALLRVASGDPILPAPEPRRYDSALEARFAREFERAAPDWELVREPRPIESGGKLIFPDFEIRKRGRPGPRFLCEIVGFWTADYLRDKLRALRAARIGGLILCIDRRRNCGAEELPEGARIVGFERRVDAGAVLAALAALESLESRESARADGGRSRKP